METGEEGIYMTWAMGKPEISLPTVKVSGPQELIRESVGCIRSCLSALRKPLGVPSHSPIRQIVVRWSSEPVMSEVVVLPCWTVTVFWAILNSPL